MNEWEIYWSLKKCLQCYFLENLIVNTQTWFLHNAVSFRLRIKVKTCNWLFLSFILLLLVEDALTLVKRFLVPITYTLEWITQMRICFLIRISFQCNESWSSAQALSKLEAKLWKQSSSHNNYWSCLST